MTVNQTQSYRQVLDKALLGTLGTCLANMKFGLMCSPMKVTVASLTAATNFDITTSTFKSKVTAYVGVSLLDGEMLPAIGQVISLRVTASGTANSVGSYAITDTGGTAVSPTAGANVGLATLSDDGKTLTFPTTVTAFVLQYIPRPAVTMTADASLVAP